MRLGDVDSFALQTTLGLSLQTILGLDGTPNQVVGEE